jgi:hypothetical protein
MFGVPAMGLKIVYVLDRSLSMGPSDALRSACQELRASLSRLPAAATFQIIVYSSTAAPLLGWPCELMPADEAHLSRAIAALGALTPSGPTRHLDALRMAVDLHPDAIYFLTDDASDLSDADCRVLLARRAAGTTIHALEFTLVNAAHPEMPVQKLARFTGGAYRGVDPASPP